MSLFTPLIWLLVMSPIFIIAFFKSKKGSKNGPFDTRMKAEDVEKNLRTVMKQSGRYKEAKEQGLSEADIEKEFKTPTKMRVFSYMTIKTS